MPGTPIVPQRGPVVPGREDGRDAGRAQVLDRRLQDVRRRAAFARRAVPGVGDDVGREVGIRILAGGVGRREEPLEALHVARRRSAALIHVPAADPLRAGSHADAGARAVVSDGDAGRRRSVSVVVAGCRSVRATGVSGAGVVHGVVPVVVMMRGRPVPAAIAGLQRRMVPLLTGVGVADDDSRARVAGGPDVRRADHHEVPWLRGRRPRGVWDRAGNRQPHRHRARRPRRARRRHGGRSPPRDPRRRGRGSRSRSSRARPSRRAPRASRTSSACDRAAVSERRSKTNRPFARLPESCRAPERSACSARTIRKARSGAAAASRRRASTLPRQAGGGAAPAGPAARSAARTKGGKRHEARA